MVFDKICRGATAGLKRADPGRSRELSTVLIQYVYFYWTRSQAFIRIWVLIRGDGRSTLSTPYATQIRKAIERELTL